MTYSAPSKAKQKREDRKDEEEKMAKAVQMYTEGQSKPPHARPGFRTVATACGVKPQTLRNRFNGMQSISQFNTTKQHLSVAEEQVLEDLILLSADRGCPLTLQDIANHANLLLKTRMKTDFQPVGEGWAGRFVDRHEKISMYWSKPLDTQRANCLNPTAVKGWFSLVKREIIDDDILPENTYNMDESGIPPSNDQSSRVSGRKGNKIQHKQGSANRENTTALVTICADGTYVKPLLIFKGNSIPAEWTENNVADVAFTSSPKGWTDATIALSWMKKVFEKETRAKAKGRTRALILDGHSSHYSLELLQYAKDHKIKILGYPPHCTHALQGLDVICFTLMKHELGLVIDNYERWHLHGVNKEDFIQVFSTAFLAAFKPETILAAFRATGIHPYDPTVITAQQMKPSEVSSTTVTHPVELKSPMKHFIPYVHKVISDYRNSQSNSSEQSASSIDTPHPLEETQELDDSNIDSPERTPKRMRVLAETLSSSESGRFLVSPTQISPSYEIPPIVLGEGSHTSNIDWKLIQRPLNQPVEDMSRAELENQIRLLADSLTHTGKALEKAHEEIDTCNAQLVFQDLLAARIKGALGEQGRKRKKTRTSLPGDSGHGIVFTSEEVTEYLDNLAKEKQDKEEARQQRVEMRQSVKTKKAAIEERWQAIQATYKAEMDEYEAKKQEWIAEGLPQKHWPSRPIRGKKPTLADMDQILVQDVAGGDDEHDSNEDSDCDGGA